jgi:hypothetical protein
MALATVFAATALIAAPVGAKTRHASPCRRIQDALAAGKTASQVSKELKVSAATVKRCTPPAAKSGEGSAANATK